MNDRKQAFLKKNIGIGQFAAAINPRVLMGLRFVYAMPLLLLLGCATQTTLAPTSIAATSTATTAVLTSTTAVSTPSAVAPTPTLLLSPTATLPATNTPLPRRSIGDPYAPELGNTGYDVQQYIIQMALDPIVTSVNSITHIDLLLTEPDLNELSFDFVGFEIDELLLNETAVPFARTENKLIVTVPTPLAVGEQARVSVTYHGAPTQERSPYVGFIGSLGMHFINQETIYVLSEPDGSRYWFPGNDHPRDKARFRFEITVPPALTAVSNGLLKEVVTTPRQLLPSGEMGHTFIWEHNDLMATYLATIAVGPYERIDAEPVNGVPIRHYIFPQDRPLFTEKAAVTAAAIAWMSDLFGPYPFEAFGFVTADVLGASLETQTMVLLSTQMIGETTIIHEIAHMWFGNWVSLDSWSEMWRNEGFATYVTLMWEHRNDPEGLELEMVAIESAVEDNTVVYPLGNPPPENLFSFHTYFGGALVVHELRQQVGDDAFFAGLQHYFQQYGGSTASDAQFQAVMEAAAGQNLDEFFATWLGVRD